MYYNVKKKTSYNVLLHTTEYYSVQLRHVTTRFMLDSHNNTWHVQHIARSKP